MPGTRKTFTKKFKILAVKLILNTVKSVESVATDFGKSILLL